MPAQGGHSSSRSIAVNRKHFRTRAELERQMNAARQLRAETLAGAICIFAALAAAAIRRISLWIAARAPHQFPSTTHRRAPGIDGPSV
jgi:hypothetical protein